LRRPLALEPAGFRPGDDNGDVVRRLASLHDQLRVAEDRLRRVREPAWEVKAATVSEGKKRRRRPGSTPSLPLREEPRTEPVDRVSGAGLVLIGLYGDLTDRRVRFSYLVAVLWQSERL
jgi:hypothetical protein